MASPDEVKKLAALARISVSDAELPKLATEFESILAYIGQVGKLSIDMSVKDKKPAVRNVFREDGEPHERGLYTQKLVEQFPQQSKNSLSVKQIISHD